MESSSGKAIAERAVLHIDMDCFYVQVERSLNPALLGVPCAVSQYNPFGNTKTVAPSDPRLWLDTNGSLIAVSYEARAAGVKRNMRAAEARKLCPQIQVVQVPVDHNKADLTPYREAGARVVQVFQKTIKNAIIEKSSIDEVYLDVTEECQRRLAIVNNSENPSAAFDALVEIARRESSIAGDDTEEMKMSKELLRRGHSGTKTVLGSINEGEDRDDHVDTTTISSSSSSSSSSDSNDNANPSADTSSTTAPLPAVDTAVASSSSSSSSSSSTMSRSWFDDPQLQWSHENQLIIVGAVIAKELRNECFNILGFTCSAGISANKMLSKIASAMHKPNRQTVVPPQQVEGMMADLPINRVVGFGGKLGDDLSDFNSKKIVTFRDLLSVNRHELQAYFGEDRTTWMLQKAIGVDTELVQDRALVSSIGCSKSFRQQNMLPQASLQDGRVLHWLKELALELEERVTNDTQLHQRKPKTLTVGLSITPVVTTTASASGASKASADPVRKWHEEQGTNLSKVGQMCIGAAAIAKAAHSMACRAVADCTRLGNKPWNITTLSLNASSFFPLANDSKAISSFFKAVASPNKASPKDKFPYNSNGFNSSSVGTPSHENQEITHLNQHARVAIGSSDIDVTSSSSSSSSNSSSSSSGMSGLDCAVAMEIEVIDVDHVTISKEKEVGEKEHVQQIEEVQQPGHDMATDDNHDNDNQQPQPQPQLDLDNAIDMDFFHAMPRDIQIELARAHKIPASSSLHSKGASGSSGSSNRGGGGSSGGGGGIKKSTASTSSAVASAKSTVKSTAKPGMAAASTKKDFFAKPLELSSPAGAKPSNNQQSNNLPPASIDSDNESDVVILDNHQPTHHSNAADKSSTNAAIAAAGGTDKSPHDKSSSSSSNRGNNNTHKRPARELTNTEKLTLKLKKTKGIERFWGSSDK